MGGSVGMITMDACLAEIHLKRLISFEMGLARSVDAKEFERLVSTGGLAANEKAAPGSATQSRGIAQPKGPTGGSVGGRGAPPVGRTGRGNG